MRISRCIQKPHGSASAYTAPLTAWGIISMGALGAKDFLTLRSPSSLSHLHARRSYFVPCMEHSSHLLRRIPAFTGSYLLYYNLHNTATVRDLRQVQCRPTSYPIQPISAEAICHSSRCLSSWDSRFLHAASLASISFFVSAKY